MLYPIDESTNFDMIKTRPATIEKIQVGDLVAHQYLRYSNNDYRLAIVIEGDDGYGDVGIVFQEIPDHIYFFGIKHLLIFE
jgi:hypothetical protein